MRSKILDGIPMLYRSKSFLLLILAQAACLAVGLGVHYFYITATITTEAEEAARAKLVGLTKTQVAAVKDAWSDNSAEARHLKTDLSQLLRDIPKPDNVGLTLAHHDWTIHSHVNTFDRAGASPPAVGSKIVHKWVDAFDLTEKPVRGMLLLDDGPHLAIGYKLNGGDAYLIAHRPVAGIPLSLGSVKPSLLVAGVITFVWTCGLLGIAAYTIASHQQDQLSRSKLGPEVEALKRAQALVRTQETVIFALAKLSDSRDGDTGDHLERISFYCSSLASALRQHPRYRDTVTPAFVHLIGVSSALHDIGKVGVEDAILRKPGLLTRDEFERMKQHTLIGEECLKEIERRLGPTNFLKMAREIASYHHERWDGKGYPHRIAGEQIPLAARIAAIADVYDALSSKRVYKDAYSHEQCVEMIREDAGKHFDPELVEVFLQIESTFRSIALRFGSNNKSDGDRPNVARIEDQEQLDHRAVPV